MDSKLLAGAYSKRYKYIEREEIENLKNDGDLQSNDVLAKARRLSQETNKRRKLLAQKRKQEAAREEKRRQEILNRRHQEQKQATEKYQRCHVGNRPRFSPSPRRRGHSPTRTHVDIEDALRLIRGSASSIPNEQSREAIQRMYNTQQNGRDPLERSHVRSSRASSAGQRETRKSQNRPLSGRPLDASMRAQLMERSLRNLTSSRSRFEQQLEQHQQLLVEQQQKSLREFNQAIRKEIDSDTKVQGVEENEPHDIPLQNESLSSLDSLEEGNQSLGNSLQGQQALKDFHQVSEHQREAFQTHSNNDKGGNTMMQHQRRPDAEQGYPPGDRSGRPQSGKAPVSRPQYDTQRQGDGPGQADRANVSAGGAHIIGPIPQGYYSSSNGAPVSSTPIIQGNLSHYPDSLDVTQANPERHIAVGTALRLPQQSPPVNQPVKQPPPSLQYDSQLLAHRRFEVHSTQNNGQSPSGNNMNTYQQEVHSKNTTTKMPEELTSALTQNEHPNERPKAHIYAWTSPPPEENGQDQYTAPSTLPPNNNTNSYSASVVADRVMATNLHPQTCRTISTAATTTWVYQTVSSAHNKEPVYTDANVSNNMTHTHQTSFGTSPSHVEIPRGQGQKPAGAHPATTGLKFVATGPQDYMQASDNRQQSDSHATDNRYQSQGVSRKEAQQTRGGTTVSGKLITMDTGQADAVKQGQKITVVEDQMDGRREVRSILKKANKDMLNPGGPTKFNVQDSLEIAKMHMRKHEQVQRKKVQKKGVRFADLHYPEEVEEDTDSMDSMIDAAATNTNASNSTQSGSQADGKTGTKGTPQRPRPTSARAVSSGQRAADARSRGPHMASAGPARQPQASRPKAAAHIIMSGDASTLTSQHGGGGHDSGITAHKSQLDKKVMLINNNFMSRVPMYSSSAVTEATTSAAAAVYTVSGAKAGSNGMHPTSSAVASDSGNSGMNGHNNKSMIYSQSSEPGRAGRGKSTASTPHSAPLPSHSHFSNTSNAYNKPIYNENGLRMDRTPTDDEINNLWKNMRTMLDVSEGKGGPTSSSVATNNDQTARQQVQLSHQYIDGAALGIPNGMRRVPGYPNSKASTAQNGTLKSEGQSKNGYLQRYSLLQQRRNPTSGIGVSSRANDVVEQTVQPMPIGAGGSDARHPAVNISYAPRDEMSESMAGFLAAEQAVQSHGPDIRDSKVMAAMESAQNQQEMYNSIRQKFAKGGPTALSLEERHLLESLDKLNERLKAVESRQTNSTQQTANYSNSQGSPQVFVHRYL
ncbi:uncharacterized protein LOC143282739 isoform X2 [Babylonia areolata]|uniref:uncharacterized protein LOC143282739 isoform X2 n=1 Tax=Babylonia areolata TaxID=304850 RepID=UPI003FD144DB